MKYKTLNKMNKNLMTKKKRKINRNKKWKKSNTMRLSLNQNHINNLISLNFSLTLNKNG